jgi:hypothetical protein
MSQTPESKSLKASPASAKFLKHDQPTDDTPDFAEEFTTSGTEKNYWKNSNNKENSKELLL